MTPTPEPSTVQPDTMPPASRFLLDSANSIAAWCADHPWILAVVAASIAAILVIRARSAARADARMRRSAKLITVTPPAEVDPAGAAVFWSTMAEILRSRRAHVCVEYRWTGRQLTIAIWVPATVAIGPIQAAIRGAWPGITCMVSDADAPLPAGITVGGALAPALPASYPLATSHDTDPMRTLIAAAANLNNSQAACVQILARPANARQMRRLRAGVTALRTGTPRDDPLDPATWLRWSLNLATAALGPSRRPAAAAPTRSADPQRERDARAAVDKLAGPQWAVAIRYAVTHTSRGPAEPDHIAARLAPLSDAIASAFGVWSGRNRLRRRRIAHPDTVLAARPLRRGFVLGAAELASIAGLPHDITVPGLSRARAKAAPAPVEVPSGGRGNKVLGTAEIGGHSVALPVADARQHTHILGSTGSGKSTLMLNMILDDIHAGRGTIVIDPKGDLVIDILDRIPATKASRLVLIDPDQNPGATLNPLDGDDQDLVVDNIVSIFSRIFAKHWGPRIDDVLRVSCLTLLRRANATLSLVPPLLNDRQFRNMFTADLDDTELRGFWEWFESTPPPLRSQVIGPILARLRAFLLRDFVRRTIGVPRSSFDMARVLDGGILLARLPKGQIGDETSRLMGSFIVASAWQAATARTRQPEASRRDATIYIDEAHNFLNLPGSIGDMLAEARGYHLGMVLAHQNLTQLPRETQLALSANARNKIYFSCAPEDAHQLARHTLPELDERDLSHMDAYRAAARLVVNGRETPAFTLHTSPSRPVVGESTAVRQAAASRMSTSAEDPAIARVGRRRSSGLSA